MSEPLPAARQVQVNLVYGMHSGLALLMDVHHPGASRGLGVVYINGSGWHAPLGYDAEALKDTPLGRPYIDALCGAGYTVFAINHRAAPRFRYPAALEDAQRAVRFVRHHAARFGIAPERIGACGGSSGGHLACLLGTLAGLGDPGDADPVNRESARAQCIVARAPPVDLRRLADGAGGAVAASFLGMLARGEAAGAYAAEHAAYRAASPLHHVGGSASPMLLIHGDADELVPYAQSERMLAALHSSQVPAALLPVPGGRHGPDFPGATQPTDYLGAMVRWFDTHLAGTGRDHSTDRPRGANA